MIESFLELNSSHVDPMDHDKLVYLSIQKIYRERSSRLTSPTRMAQNSSKLHQCVLNAQVSDPLHRDSLHVLSIKFGV